MGLIRKAASVSTLGGVNYTSKGEKKARAAKAQGKLAEEEARAVRDQRHRDARDDATSAAAAKWEPVVAAIEAGEASWDDLSRVQKLSMPIGYQLRCKAAQRRRA